MIIKKIKIRNFRNFENIEKEFSTGVIVVKGPNEAGKSSLLNALKLSVFGDATSRGAETLSQKRWNSDILFLIEVHFQDEKGVYIISRDYENKKNILNLPDGTTLRDKKRIQEKLIELIGLPSEKCFLSTICISQDEIKKIDAGLPEIKKLLEEKISGGGVDLNEILKSLDKESKELKKAGPQNPGLIKQAENKRSELESQSVPLREKVSKLENCRIELSQVSENSPKLSEAIQLQVGIIENAQKYLDIKRRFNEASKKYDEIERITTRRKMGEEAFKKTTKDLKDIEQELREKEKKLKGGEKFLELIARKDDFTQKLKKLSNDINKLTVLKKDLSDIRSKISKKKEIDPKDYRNALDLPGEIAGLEAGLSSREIIVSLLPQKRFNLLFKIDDSDEKTQVLKEKLEIAGKTRIQLKINELVDVDILNKEEQIQALFEELRRKRSVLHSMFKRYGVTSVRELEDAWNELQELKKSENEKTIEYETILSERRVEEIEGEEKEYFEKIEPLDKELDKIKEYFIKVEEKEVLETEVEKLRYKRERLKESADKNLGALEELKEEEKLEEERKAAVKELAIYKAEFERLEMFQCTGEEFVRQELVLKKLKENLLKLEARKGFLEMVIKENENIGIEDIVDLEEKLSFKEKEIYKLKRKTEIDNIISEMLFKARIQTIKDISGDLSRKIGENLSYITSGRYNKIRLGENLDMTLWSDKKDGWINTQSSYQELSSGILDQLFLAARFALTEILTPGKNLPIFMDDPFAHFDPKRRAKALELCKKLAEKHQVLIFTCHDYCDEFADEKLILSDELRREE